MQAFQSVFPNPCSPVFVGGHFSNYAHEYFAVSDSTLARRYTL